MDSVYLPFMQANVLNYSQKLFDYFGRDIIDKINSSFMTLVINNEEVSEEHILSRYGDNIVSRYYKMKDETERIITDNANEKLAIKMDEPVRIIKEYKDTNLIHCYKQKRVREMVLMVKQSVTECSYVHKNVDLKDKCSKLDQNWPYLKAIWIGKKIQTMLW